MINWVRVRMVDGTWNGRLVKRLFVGEKQIDTIVYWEDDEIDIGWHSDSYPQIEVAKTAEEIAKQVLEWEKYL